MVEENFNNSDELDEEDFKNIGSDELNQYNLSLDELSEEDIYSDGLDENIDPLIDPVEEILEFAKFLEGKRSKQDSLKINDRDRWLVTLALSLISDPNNRLGKKYINELLKVWANRGGKIYLSKKYLDKLKPRNPNEAPNRRLFRQPDRLEFAVQYLLDAGVHHTIIAEAFGYYHEYIFIISNQYKKRLKDINSIDAG